ncbi:hypothetical protein BDZ94DRAFT_103750 [Collybia nuda]|uniref:Uncharacterized protein n=1 Tax=Collybia nuda TaxID=64659 RepID=A0A9P6CAH3_9AGAR|nr:hypothetical protein BDZ94DRAFT_103750 [Collybia nuda]
MTTWATSTPIRHPWFSQPTTKRKHSIVSNTVDCPHPHSSSPSHSPPTKRRKFSALESGFAYLTLSDSRPNPSFSSPLPHISEPLCNVNNSSSPMSTESDASHNIVIPMSVEVPLAPEVKMKKSSWYEPEPDRIIVTDLDSSSDEEDVEVDPDTATIAISRTLLKQLSSHARELTEPFKPQNSNNALVLFRPLRPMRDVVTQISRDRQEMSHLIDVVRDSQGDDAMDVETG